MPKPTPTPDPAAVAAYINAAPEPARTRLQALADAVRAEAPAAVERIAYGLATWHQGENLIHLGAFQHHVGIYPGPEAIVAFADELSDFKTSKGAIQVPHDAPLPTELVRRLTRWRLEQATANASQKAPARRSRGADAVTGQTDIEAYNAAQSEPHRAVCEALAAHIAQALPEAEGKVWHGHPVWFLAHNPVVGYSAHKDATRLLFWSGQSLDEPALAPVGKFQAAEARFATVADLNADLLRRWLGKAQSIQWDYKNIVKNKGVLVRLR